MKQYVRNRITFTGDPETLRPLKADLETKCAEGPFSLSAVLPLPAGADPQQIWGTPSEAEEADGILYRDGTVLEYTFDTLTAPPVLVFEALARRTPSLRMTVHYASEDYGEGCGIFRSESGSAELKTETPEDPFEFACEVWDVDPEEELQERYINWMEE